MSLLLPVWMNVSTGSGDTVYVTVGAGGIALTEDALVATLNDEARIVNLPADLSVSLSDSGLSTSLSGGYNVALTEQEFNVEICDG